LDQFVVSEAGFAQRVVGVRNLVFACTSPRFRRIAGATDEFTGHTVAVATEAIVPLAQSRILADLPGVLHHRPLPVTLRGHIYPVGE